MEVVLRADGCTSHMPGDTSDCPEEGTTSLMRGERDITSSVVAFAAWQ